MGILKKFTTRDIYFQAERAREQEKYNEALALLGQAVVEYQNVDAYRGIVAVLQSRVLTYKQLFLVTNKFVYRVLAQKDAEASLLIVEENKLIDTLSSCYFQLGEAAMLFDNYPKALEYYELALIKHVGSRAEKGRYNLYLGKALYKIGKKTQGINIMIQGIQEIVNNADEIDDFSLHLWLYDGYLHLATFFLLTDQKEAKKYLIKAKQIIEADNRLVIGNRQLKEFEEKIKKAKLNFVLI